MKMKKLLAVLMAVLMVALCFSACGGNEAKIVVAEAGSAGEEVMNTDDYFADCTKTPVDTQAKALMEVKSGTADMAVIDYVMSIGSIGEGTDYADLKLVEDVSFAPEEYGIAFRKGSDAVNYVNKAINELKADGTLAEIASKYKLQDLLLGDGKYEEVKAEESDWEYIKNKGKLVVGITLFAPMNYKDANDELIGFETEFAKAVCAKLGLEVEFQVIDWNSKETELASKNIDCIWNGMTISEEVKLNTNCTDAYVKNAQVVVMAKDKAADYKDAASMKDLSFAVEAGSAGATAASDNGLANIVEAGSQTDALLEVASGSCDACIIDITMAKAMVEKDGSSYSELGIACELTSEEYGIGCREGSDLTAELNKLMGELKADGTLVELASKYELTLAE